MLQGANKSTRFVEGLVRSGVEPRRGARKYLDAQFAALEVGVVEGRDLEFAPVTRLQFSRELRRSGVVEVDARHREGTLGLERLLLNGKHLAVIVKLNDPVGRGVTHLIRKDQGAINLCVCFK